MPDQSLDRGGGGRRQSSLLGQNLVKQLVEKDKGMESEEEDKEQKEEEGEVNEDGEEDEEIGWKKKRRKRARRSSMCDCFNGWQLESVRKNFLWLS